MIYKIGTLSVNILVKFVLIILFISPNTLIKRKPGIRNLVFNSLTQDNLKVMLDRKGYRINTELQISMM